MWVPIISLCVIIPTVNSVKKKQVILIIVKNAIIKPEMIR